MAEFGQRWRDWRVVRERELVDPKGWLALVSLEWLTEEPTAYAGFPGLWWRDDKAAYVDPQGAELVWEGEKLDGVTAFDQLTATGPGARVESGDLELEIALRGDGHIVRVRDPHAEALRDFKGVPAYEPDSAWVLTGTYHPFDAPRPTTVGAVVAGLSHVYESPGTVTVEHGGTTHTLTAFNGVNGGLSLLFTDATSGVTTYAANRSLKTARPAADGTVALDFNRAVNLPCAFTPYATCPLPPEGNHLPFAVEAGEKTPLT